MKVNVCDVLKYFILLHEKFLQFDYFEIPTGENYKPFAGSRINKQKHDLYVIFSINTTRDISKLSQISLA